MADDKRIVDVSKSDPAKIDFIPPVHNGIMSHGRTIYLAPQPKQEPPPPEEKKEQRPLMRGKRG
jgi:hypothetical protein